MSQKRILWVGDAGCSTGFERCTRHACDSFYRAGWDVHVLGINHSGDPAGYPYLVYPAARPMTNDDAFGVRRLRAMAPGLDPDVIVLLNDPWNVPDYMTALEEIDVPVIGWLAVDGKNCRGDALEGLAHAVFWTDFGVEEARLGGWNGPSSVIPLGVDRRVYAPRDRDEALDRLGILERARDQFIVGTIARNQPRKRLDLTVAYFAEWIHEYGVDDAQLLMHVAPTGEMGWNLPQLRSYYDLDGHFLLSDPPTGHGVPEEDMPWLYAAMDVQVSTTQGEGFGLPVLEGMASGIPQLVPDWSALGEWPGDAAVKVPCSHIVHTHNLVNAMGGVPGRKRWIQELDRLYRDDEWRGEMSRRGIAKAAEDRFDWREAGSSFVELAESVAAASDRTALKAVS